MSHVSPITTYLLILLAHTAAAGVAFYFGLEWLYLAIVGASLLVACMFVHALYWSVRGRACPAVSSFHDRVAVLFPLLDHQEVAAQEQHEHDRRACMEEHIQRTTAIEDSVNARVCEEEEKKELARRMHHERFVREQEALTRKKDADLQALEAGCAQTGKEPKLQYDAGLKQIDSNHAARGKQLLNEREQAIGKVAAEWSRALCGFRDFAKEAMADCQQSHPDWGATSWSEWQMPGTFPRTVRAGTIHLDLQKIAPAPGKDPRFVLPCERVLTLPVVLSYARWGSVFLSAGPDTRSEGLQLLFNLTLRTLTSFPPGKAKLTILDPVGLGQNFSALMHLADYDESLVGGRIWAESTHIERRLAELTEHLEKVIQKYLRGRYNSIGDYNREAGDLAEAYQFLVIADFPTGFSELALDRLASVIASGVRCGVYTLILHDGKQKLPDVIDRAHLRQNGLVVAERNGRLAIDDDAVKDVLFAGEHPPELQEATALLHSIGKQCEDAKRVEVPFEMIMPPEGEQWSASSEAGIRVPIGRTGADRSQYLDVGQGTAQHVLVSGKTGSGKSTLFHVLITNVGLWFSPREVEFFLIDFKKGVEFKRFATTHLPHARVIAIESDREFGVSVLERIDREFAYRADLFRERGVQDLAGHRQSGSDEHLPRILLIIDEFQEFFTEDDAVAQQAALLLDRIVRQGRAFGVHVILGSQTLGGAYTLARSTFGQMAVRIALQCNEADSYLILSDDNAAARLLARPGEAIYNDMSGLVEGNNPFQVVWLSDEVQDTYLRMSAQKAEQQGWTPREPVIVFEGNVAADLENNVPLKHLLARKFDAATDVGGPLWLGEASTIKGPTEVRFQRQGGSNLLMVGQRIDAAYGVVTSAVLSLAAHHATDRFRIIVLDGSGGDAEKRDCLLALAEAVPHNLRLGAYRDVPQVLEELDAEVRARQEGATDAREQICLIVFGLQRFRQLRQEDEFDFSTDESDALSPSKCFTNILTEGPEQGVHSIVWCDSLNNLNRTFNRKTLREFELRVLFQMSPTDSADLTDTALASDLGLYKALLFIEADGITEKFRPYGVPAPQVIAHFGERLAARFC